MNHTPGPWLIHDKDPRDVRELNGKRFVANCRDSQDYRTHEEACANARLIAAAPELLLALEWVTRCAKMKGPAGTLAYFISDEAMSKARAAIAKATGS